MQKNLKKIGFGGGCHWCTEAVFQSLVGVAKVEQGWIASEGKNDRFSEAVLVYFDASEISLKDLIAIHLYTHSCMSSHSMRTKYRSAVYTFSKMQNQKVEKIILDLQTDFEKPIITQNLPFVSFRENKERYQNYYLKNSENQFCKNYINPKLSLLMNRFAKHLK
ncbi:MAG: peptide-methionine (S)-S-oxide reductase [Saprospiraceae bacterium]